MSENIDHMRMLADRLDRLRLACGTLDTDAIRRTLDELAVVVSDTPEADSARLLLSAIIHMENGGLPEHDAIQRTMDRINVHLTPMDRIG